MKRPVIGAADFLTFADYCKLTAETDEVVAYFGYSHATMYYELPTTKRSLERVEDLKSRLQEALPYVSLTSETARREFLIAPIIMDLVHYTHSRIRVEYPVDVNAQLKGTLDYYVQGASGLLVVEAKNADLSKGFTQLAVELIALDKWIENGAPILYGAV